MTTHVDRLFIRITHQAEKLIGDVRRHDRNKPVVRVAYAVNYMGEPYFTATVPVRRYGVGNRHVYATGVTITDALEQLYETVMNLG